MALGFRLGHGQATATDSELVYPTERSPTDGFGCGARFGIFRFSTHQDLSAGSARLIAMPGPNSPLVTWRIPFHGTTKNPTSSHAGRGAGLGWAGLGWEMVFGAAILLNAFLLFQVQPLISRYILPWFADSPALWTTAMLFFQLVLFVGYSYAHLSARVLGKRNQV